MKPFLAFLSKWGAMLLAVPFLGFWTWKTLYPPVPPSQMIQCASLVAGCTVHVNEKPLFIQFLSPPSGKVPFILHLQGQGLVHVEAALTMMGMEMPPARFPLKKEADGTFKVALILPICSLSRSDWHLQLKLNEQIRLQVPFSTD